MNPIKIINKGIVYLISLFFLVIFGFPFVLTLLMSFKSQAEYMRGNYWSPPTEIYFGNYLKILGSDFNFYFANSIFVSTLSVALIIFLGSLAGYAFAKIKFKNSGILLMVFLVGMMIPVHTTLIPIYQMTKSFNLTNRLIGLVGPYVSFGLPVAIFILSSFIKEIPDSIKESAVIDGANQFTIYYKIMLPLSVPAISTVAIYNFLVCWNEFIYSMTLINSRQKHTLPLGIRQFYGSETINIPSVLTAVLVGSLPVVLFYLFAQEKVINGLSAGAVKG